MSDAYGRVLDKALALTNELAQVDQILGKALHYPYYADDQKNFPNATREREGVCTGESTPIDLALQAARRINRLEKFIMSTIGTVESDPEILEKFLRGI